MKKVTIDLFMWGYQRHFHSSVTHYAEELLKSIHPELKCEVFLLGIARDHNKDSHQVCLEPEECGFTVSDFSGIKEDAEHRIAIDEESEVICMDPKHHENFHSRVRNKAYTNAVLSRLIGWRSKKSGEFYFSGFAPLKDYMVGIVFLLQNTSEENIYKIPKLHAQERYRPYSSLVHAAIEEFLFECVNCFNVPDPDSVDIYHRKSTGEIIREAGNRFLDTPAWATGNLEALYGIFSGLNAISALRYESEEGVGRMIVARDGHPNVKTTIRFKRPVRLSLGRAARKLLEVAASGDSMICNGYMITGFGHTIGVYDQSKSDLFEIDFTSHFTWELSHGGHRIMRCSYGNPSLPLAPINRRKFEDDLRRIFTTTTADQRTNLVDLVLAACNQRHGTTLVFSSRAEFEAERLARQATPIEPVKLTPELVSRVTSIDGAVLVDPDGVCYAFGVILDGVATASGNPARGARYNSAVRYVEQYGDCCVLVVSEDGTAEWIPNLRPQIKKTELDENLASAEILLREGFEDLKNPAKVVNWLSDHQFYLNSDACDTANLLAEAFENKSMELRGMKLIRPKLIPDPDMNDSYFI